MSQLVPAGEGECERQTNTEMMRKEQKKNLRDGRWRKGGGSGRRGLRVP